MSMPLLTVPAELQYTTNTNTILPFSPSTRTFPSPHPSTFLSYIHSLPQWEQLMLKRVHLHTDVFTVTSCWNALESLLFFCFTNSYDLIFPKTNFLLYSYSILLSMTLVIRLPRLMFCCVELLPQDQTPHTLHRFHHLFWESPANC